MALSLVVLTSCTTAIEHVKNSQNDYYYYNNRFTDKCPTRDSNNCPEFKDQSVLLQKWFVQLKEADDAINRGGKLPLQEKALTTTEKEMKKKAKGW